MKKLLFLVIFVLISFTILFAEEEEEGKKFDIANGGIVRLLPMGGVLNVKIIYDDASKAPEVTKHNLGDNGRTGRLRKGPSRFNVKLLADNGAVICKQSLSFDDFILGQSDGHPIITLEYRTQQCGINSYEKIAAVVVDYGNY
jgi:hypothetical protein